MTPVAIGDPPTQPMDGWSLWLLSALRKIERAARRPWPDVFPPNRYVVNVKDSPYSAIGNGTSDDTLAFIRARAAAVASGFALYIPSGRYNLATIGDRFELWDRATIFGDGIGATTVVWNDQGDADVFLSHDDSGVRISDVSLRDFTIEGSGADSFGAPVSYPILLRDIDGLRIIRVASHGSRAYGMAIRNSNDVLVDGCDVFKIQSAGISVAGCSNARVVNCRVDSCDDDGIDFHTQAGGDLGLNRGVIIANNTLSKCQGIKGLSAVSSAVVGNTLDFCFGNGISVHSLAAGGTSEGDNAGQGVVIANNVIRNMMNRQYIDNLNQSGWYIVIGGASARAGSLSAVPGYNVTATGAIVDPYLYYLNDSATSTVPIPPSGAIVISGNVCERTVPPTALFSDYGYGELFTRNGPVDFEVVANALYGVHSYGVEVRGGIMDMVQIEGNQFRGMGGGVFFTSNPTMAALSIARNLFKDLPLGGIVVPNGGVTAESKTVDDNRFDLDPYMKHSGRNADGSWDATDNLIALFYNASTGWVTRRNIFANCSEVTNIATQTGTVHFWQDNILEGYPTAIGFAAGNLGIGNVIRGPDFKSRVIDCDPTSATFRQILNEPELAANQMPDTGVHVAGQVCWNSVPNIISAGTSDYVIIGWVRVTTGGNNVLDTDWAEMRTLTGT